MQDRQDHDFQRHDRVIETMAELREQNRNILAQIAEMKVTQKATSDMLREGQKATSDLLREGFVSKVEFEARIGPLFKLTYGTVSAILLAVLAVIVAKLTDRVP